jgi:transposase-like protein
VRGKEPEKILGKEGLLKQVTKRLGKRALEDEMKMYVGHEKHAGKGNSGGKSRNGKKRKQV